MKPEYDAGKNLKEQLDAAVAFYDSEMSLQAIGDELGLNPIKVRKLLITAGVYESEVAQKVQDTFEEYREIQDYKTSIRDIEVCEKVERATIPYRFSDMRQDFGRSTPNLSEFLKSEKGIRFILQHRTALRKCVTQRRIQSILEETNSENAGDKRNGFAGLAAAEEMLEPVPISSKPSNKSS